MSGQQPASPHAASALELKAQIEAEREGLPFLIYRDGDARHRLLRWKRARTGSRSGGARRPTSLFHGMRRSRGCTRNWCAAATIGRSSDNGLSLNGSFVNGEAIRGRRRLRDGDAVRVGATVIVFRNPRDGESSATAPSAELRKVVSLTPAQKRVFVALCRPFKESAVFVTPPTNDQIAGELFLSVDAVKKHLRALFEKFGVEHLPQNEKRARLVERAFAGGFISERKL